MAIFPLRFTGCNISLPVKGYENLRMNLITILKKFNQLLPVLTRKKYLNELLNDIKLKIGYSETMVITASGLAQLIIKKLKK